MGCFTLDKTRSEEREDEGHEINLDLLKSVDSQSSKLERESKESELLEIELFGVMELLVIDRGVRGWNGWSGSLSV